MPAAPFSIAYPLVGGHRYSFASIEIWMGGAPKPIIGFKSINYGEELEPGEIWGTSPHKIGRTRGKHNANCDFEMYRLEWENLKTSLGVNGIGFGEMMFDIRVGYSENGGPVVTDFIGGCRITKVEFSNSEGTDASTAKITCNVMRIITNTGPGGGTIVAAIRA